MNNLIKDENFISQQLNRINLQCSNTWNIMIICIFIKWDVFHDIKKSRTSKEGLKSLEKSNSKWKERSVFRVRDLQHWRNNNYFYLIIHVALTPLLMDVFHIWRNNLLKKIEVFFSIETMNKPSSVLESSPLLL